ncbi:MAG: 6-bladed beta-propeller [Cyclobacteriaceae bacterium]
MQVILVSCTLEEKIEADLIVADLENESKVSVFDYFEEARVICLQVDNDNIIAQISQLEFFDQKIYVFDQTQQTLFCFDFNGNLIMKISSQGHGPGEYAFATNFTIDPYNRHILFLSPSFSQITAFNLEGEFEARMEIKEMLGYNYLAPINDSVLMLTSVNQYQTLFYCLNNQNIFKKVFELPYSHLHHLVPGSGHFYRFNERVFVLPVMENTIKDVTDVNPTDHLMFSFGKFNNSARQWNEFMTESDRLPLYENLRMHQIVGNGKILNSHILKISEVDRFVILIVVCDDTVKHLILDKHDDSLKVFRYFDKNITVNPMYAISENIMIAFETRNYQKQRAQEFYQNLFSYYDADFYSKDILSERCRQIIRNHNPMTDNPFLVVYKFKE